MHGFRPLYLLPVLLAATHIVAAHELGAIEPRSFLARYDIEARGFTVGDARWRVTRVEDGFVYETRSEAVGVAALLGDRKVVQRSEWEPFEGELKPARYRYNRSDRPDKNVSVDFYWDKGIARNTRRGKTVNLEIPADTMDKLSYVLRLMKDIHDGKREVHYNIVDGKNRVKIYTLRVLGTVRIETALGALDTVKIVRDRKDDDRETVIWIAPSLDYVPVRIEHHERDGEEVIIRIRSISYGSAPALEKAGTEPKSPTSTLFR